MKKQLQTLNNILFQMTSKIYNIELDWIIIEKIVMRAVLAVVSFNCLA